MSLSINSTGNVFNRPQVEVQSNSQSRNGNVFQTPAISEDEMSQARSLEGRRIEQTSGLDSLSVVRARVFALPDEDAADDISEATVGSNIDEIEDNDPNTEEFSESERGSDIEERSFNYVSDEDISDDSDEEDWVVHNMPNVPDLGDIYALDPEGSDEEGSVSSEGDREVENQEPIAGNIARAPSFDRGHEIVGNDDIDGEPVGASESSDEESVDDIVERVVPEGNLVEGNRSRASSDDNEEEIVGNAPVEGHLVEDDPDVASESSDEESVDDIEERRAPGAGLSGEVDGSDDEDEFPLLSFSRLFANEEIYNRWRHDMIMSNPIFSKPGLKLVKKREVFIDDRPGVRCTFSDHPHRDVPYVEICIKNGSNTTLDIDLWHGPNKVSGESNIERQSVNLRDALRPVIFRTPPSRLSVYQPSRFIFSNLFTHDFVYEMWIEQMRIKNPILKRHGLEVVTLREFRENNQRIRTVFSRSSDRNDPYVEVSIKRGSNSFLDIELWHGRNKISGERKLETKHVRLNEAFQGVVFTTVESQLFTTR